MKVSWSPRAAAEFDRILEDAADYGGDAPERAFLNIETAVDRLADHPHAARPGRIEGTRELVLKRLPYILVYRVGPDEVTLLTLRHTARDWPNTLA